MDRWEAIKLNAFWSVFNAKRKQPKPDLGYELDRLHRWYAKTFNVSIAEAEAVPTDEVFRTYWLETYEGYEQKDLDQEREQFIQDPIKLRERQREEDAEDYELFLLGQEIAEENKQAAPTPRRGWRMPQRLYGTSATSLFLGIQIKKVRCPKDLYPRTKTLKSRSLATTKIWTSTRAWALGSWRS